MLQAVIGTVVGAAGAVCANRLAKFQIEKRTDDKSVSKKLDYPIVIAVWCIICAALTFAMFITRTDLPLWARYINIIILAVCSAIGAVDFLIKKIPNDSLLILIVAQIVMIISKLVSGGNFKTTVLPSILGLVIGYALYIIPSLFFVAIGAGDIKYCAIIGFMFGLTGFLEVSVVMALILSVYYIYLKVTKRGNIKTTAAMGPFLSIGVAVALIVPLQWFFSIPYLG